MDRSYNQRRRRRSNQKTKATADRWETSVVVDELEGLDEIAEEEMVFSTVSDAASDVVAFGRYSYQQMIFVDRKGNTQAIEVVKR